MDLNTSISASGNWEKRLNDEPQGNKEVFFEVQHDTN